MGGFFKSVIKSLNPDIERKLWGAIKKSEVLRLFRGGAFNIKSAFYVLDEVFKLS